MKYHNEISTQYYYEMSQWNMPPKLWNVIMRYPKLWNITMKYSTYMKCGNEICPQYYEISQWKFSTSYEIWNIAMKYNPILWNITMKWSPY